MAVRPMAFLRDGDVPYQSISIIMQVGETRLIPGTLRYVQLRAATDPTKINISFNGSSFYNLPQGEQLADFEADGIWIQNTDVAPNAVTIVTGMASLNSTRVIIDSSTALTTTILGTAAVSSVQLDALVKSVYALSSLATNNAALIASGVRRVHSLTMFNASAGIKYVRLYDKATAPTVGTDVAFRVYAIPAGLSLTVAFPGGDQFALGLGIAITGAAPYNDNTAVAANDVQLALVYV